MFGRSIKVLLVVVLTALASANGIASAASTISQIEVCAGRKEQPKFSASITGKNQEGREVRTPAFEVPAGGCYLKRDWWWKQGVSMYIAASTTDPLFFFIVIPKGAGQVWTVRLDRV